MAGVANASNTGITNYINQTMQAVYTAGARKCAPAFHAIRALQNLTSASACRFVVLNIPPLNALPIFSPPYSMGSMSSNAIVRPMHCTSSKADMHTSLHIACIDVLLSSCSLGQATAANEAS